jgi:hypothetical protein
MDKKESVSGMDVVKKIAQRAKEVLLKPRDTFGIIKTETVTSRDLILDYLAPLAVIPAIASVPLKKVMQVGNAAAEGAKGMLLSRGKNLQKNQ